MRRGKASDKECVDDDGDNDLPNGSCFFFMFVMDILLTWFELDSSIHRCNHRRFFNTDLKHTTLS